MIGPEVVRAPHGGIAHCGPLRAMRLRVNTALRDATVQVAP
ncbi:hypothetical protein I545_5866 [Mycobacterium kansasii 662]|uniref:Uncharacterized protein n=1 Tax=Mycobacterium kansasii 662 TaxID=1299326 RepID=X7YTN6_MYCKA|nr:hypothetical protein I545_5866 [Mycobacterium kansasii 662]